MKLQIAVSAAAVTAALLVPAVADAHRVSSSQSVRVHAGAADRALAQFTAAVAVDADAKAARALVRNRRQTRAASREARRLRMAVKGVRSATRASSATTAVALQTHANAEALAGTLDEVGGDLKVDVAVALKSDLVTGAGALAGLTGLVDDVPATAQGAIAQAIAVLSQGQQIVNGIVAALNPAVLQAALEQSLSSSLAVTLATVDASIEALNRLTGVVAAAALPLVQSALATATAQLQGLAQALQGVGALVPGLPALGDGLGSVEIGIDGSQSVAITGLCGLVGALPFTPLGC